MGNPHARFGRHRFINLDFQLFCGPYQMITTKTQTRLFHWLARTLAVLCVFILMLFIWSKYFEEPYLTFQNLPFPVLAKAYPGRVVPLAIERCNLSHWKRTYVTTH